MGHDNYPTQMVWKNDEKGEKRRASETKARGLFLFEKKKSENSITNYRFSYKMRPFSIEKKSKEKLRIFVPRSPMRVPLKNNIDKQTKRKAPKTEKVARNAEKTWENIPQYFHVYVFSRFFRFILMAMSFAFSVIAHRVRHRTQFRFATILFWKGLFFCIVTRQLNRSMIKMQKRWTIPFIFIIF